MLFFIHQTKKKGLTFFIYIQIFFFPSRENVKKFPCIFFLVFFGICFISYSIENQSFFGENKEKFRIEFFIWIDSPSHNLKTFGLYCRCFNWIVHPMIIYVNHVQYRITDNFPRIMKYKIHNNNTRFVNPGLCLTKLILII